MIKVCRPNKALRLSGFIKTKNVVLGLIREANHVFKEEERRKRGEKLGFG